VIEIAEKILDLEPHDRATVLAGATVTFNWLVSAVQAGIPGLPPQSTNRQLISMCDVIIFGDRRKASKS
jgi:hypothetical protein